MAFESIPKEKIEILGLDIFQTHSREIEIVENYRDLFDAVLGWHYYLDIAWILKEISALPKGSLILDAGAGYGILQFILADQGYNVISADFTGRDFSTGYARRYENVIHALNCQKRSIYNDYTNHLRAVYAGRGSGLLERLLSLFGGGCASGSAVSCIARNRFTPVTDVAGIPDPGDSGRIFLYKCDIGDMKLLPDDIVDGVVSVSALEHNDHSGFDQCVSELLRVTRSAGRLLVTISASQTGDWFHQPSKGWCYGEESLKKLFRLKDRTPSNFSRRDDLFEALKTEGNELRKRLSRAYFDSGDNGMPWGVWNPQYQPVAVVKIKGTD